MNDIHNPHTEFCHKSTGATPCKFSAETSAFFVGPLLSLSKTSLSVSLGPAAMAAAAALDF